MEPLEYQSGLDRTPSVLERLLLIALPLAVPFIVYLAILSTIRGPFWWFSLLDVALYVGTVMIALGAIPFWYLLARRRKIYAIILVAVIGWLTFVAWVAVGLVREYFSQP